MKTLRFVRNVSALFILAIAVAAAWPGAQIVRAQKTGNSCFFGPNTVGYNCTFSGLTCSSSKCKAGQACNNGVCGESPYTCGYKKGHNCGFDDNGKCKESLCQPGGLCLNTGCI